MIKELGTLYTNEIYDTNEIYETINDLVEIEKELSRIITCLSEESDRLRLGTGRGNIRDIKDICFAKEYIGQSLGSMSKLLKSFNKASRFIELYYLRKTDD